MPRYSSDPNDPGYQNWLDAGRKVYVYVNRLLYDDVVVADEDEGFIIRHKRNEYGTVTLVDGEIPTETIRGRVVVKKVSFPARVI